MGIAGVDTGCAEDGGRVIAAAAENRCSGLQAEQRGCFRQKRGNQLLRANDTFWQQPPRDSAEGDLRIIPTAMMRIVKTCCPSAGVLVGNGAGHQEKQISLQIYHFFCARNELRLIFHKPAELGDHVFSGITLFAKRLV